MVYDKLSSITKRIINDPNAAIDNDEACELATTTHNAIDLIISANKIRETYKADDTFTCSIINAKSGACSEDCAFCPQSAFYKTKARTYPLLDKSKIVERAIEMWNGGANKFSMVTSGYALTEKELDLICEAAILIKEKTGLSLCGSLGVLNEDIAERLKASGLTNYHHNLETARSFFDQVCTTHPYDDDIKSVKIAARAGFKVCSGGIMGLGESWEQRIELAFTLKELDVESIPLNFINPIPGTKMAERPLLAPMDALKCIALYRLINPLKDITICGGREISLGDYQSWTFLAGANGLMVGDYLTTMGRGLKIDMEMIRNMEI